jgi:TP901 family phage tail tape measure protein
VAEQLGEAVLSIKADTQQLEAGLQRARQGLRNVEQDTASAASGFDRLGSAFGKLAAQLALLETARRVALFTGQQIQDLDSASAAVRTLGVNSEELTTKLRALSVELGGNVSVIELTKAAYDVASSGFASAGEATQVLRAASLGAKGGFAELNDVVSAVTGVLNAYGTSADQATNIVDTFLQTQNDGVITVRQYAAEIGNVASIAAASGVSLQELNAAIATATLRGVPVAQTFTGIRQALSSIIKPSEQAKDLARALGLDYSVAALQTKGFAGVLADVQAKTGGATDKLAVLLGSVEAQAAIQPLLNDRLVKYNELLGKQAQSSGAAAAAAKINAETISGGLAQIGNGFSNLATTLDKSLKPVFAGLIASLNDILTKLQQVSALSPEKVTAREQQATRIIDNVKQNSPNYNTRAFYGTPLVSPNTEIVFDGKTFKGTITGVRNDLVKYLLQKDLEAINKPAAAGTVKAPPKPAATPAPTPVDPNLQGNIQLANQAAALELRNTRDRIEATQQLNALDAVGRQQLENRLASNEKLRATDALRLQLARELDKPKDDGTSQKGAQSLERVADLQNQIKRSEAETALLRVQQEQAEAQSLRTQQEKVRQSRLDAVNAADKLKVTQQLTALELRTPANQQVSATAKLQLQQQLEITQKLRQEEAARAALATELARPKGQQDRVVVGELQDRVRKANQDVVQAYADAGLSLVQNAKTAAEALRGAQQNLSSIQRGGFEFLNPQLQRQEIARARASIQPLVDSGQIRTGIDISTPEKLFRVAAFAEQLAPAQKQLEDAVRENATATKALSDKNWTVNVSVNGAPAPAPVL